MLYPELLEAACAPPRPPSFVTPKEGRLRVFVPGMGCPLGTLCPAAPSPPLCPQIRYQEIELWFGAR